jgi:acetyl esterase
MDLDTPLDPGMMMFCKAVGEQTPPGAEKWPLAKQRAEWDAVCKQFRAPRPAIIEVVDLSANGVPVRIFKPKDKPSSPGVIYAHGGGWVLGSCETHDDMCAEMAAGAQCTVALYDYRLAPEYPHPAQLEDALKLWRWMQVEGPSHGINPSHIIAAGDSCGGQMSVALALTLQELGLPQVAAMLLIYPVLGIDMSTSSYIRNANAPGLTRAEMDFYLNSFLGPPGSPGWSDAKALPSLAEVNGLPPAYITVAGHDPLHDDGVFFARKLRAAQIPVELRHEPALAHSYMRARHHSPVAMDAFQSIVTALKRFAHPT